MFLIQMFGVRKNHRGYLMFNNFKIILASSIFLVSFILLLKKYSLIIALMFITSCQTFEKDDLQFNQWYEDKFNCMCDFEWDDCECKNE